MIRVSKLEKSIITRKPIEEKDRFRSEDEHIVYHVGEITKAVIEDSGNDVLIDFYDDKGRVFSVMQRAYVPLYRATCLISLDVNAVINAKFARDKGEFLRTRSLWCSDPRVVWMALVEIWLHSAAPKDLRDDKNLSQILTDLIPSYDEAIENLEKNQYPPFASCFSDIKYASEKYRGETLEGRRHFDYSAYLKKHKGWLIEPPTVDWSKYGG